MGEPGFHFIGRDQYGTPNDGATVDVVFVHGLSGGALSSWSATKEKGSYWPQWLADDCANANVWVAGYDSSFFTGIGGEGATLRDRATTLVDCLAGKCLGTRPILFIAHSLGGLVVKEMLRVCSDLGNADYKKILDHTRGVVFCGTPHRGTKLAELFGSILGGFASKHLKELGSEEEKLHELHTWFVNWVAAGQVAIKAYHETKKTSGAMVVQKGSADPQIAGCLSIAVDGDHDAVCKPATHESNLYVTVKALVSSFSNISRLLALPPPTATAAALAPTSTALPPTSTALVPASPSFDLTVYSAGNEAEVATAQPGADFELMADYQYFTTMAPDDRRPLAEKLVAGGRASEVSDGNRKKERFAMSLHRYSAQASSLGRYIRLMSNVESRFNRLVRPAIAAGAAEIAVNQIVQTAVIEPALDSLRGETDDATATLVESALYYLTGNCHVRWDGK